MNCRHCLKNKATFIVVFIGGIASLTCPDCAQGLCLDQPELVAYPMDHLHRFRLERGIVVEESKGRPTMGNPNPKWETVQVFYAPKDRPLCGLCGLAVTGTAQAEGVRLCHSDDKNCYHRWVVNGERP